jgi:hypothetical protein
VQPGVDHLEARIAQRARDDFGPAIVTVEPRLRDENPSPVDGAKRRLFGVV